MSRHLRAIALAVGLSVAPGCAKSHAPEPPSREAAMAVLGTVRALHHEADVYESTGDFERAANAMRRALAVPLPAGLAEADDVRADAWGRLAELDLRRERPDEALAHADEGIRNTPRESVLQARLYMVRGQCLRALADRATQQGDGVTAARRRDEALAALEHSIEVNGRILRGLTEGGRR